MGLTDPPRLHNLFLRSFLVSSLLCFTAYFSFFINNYVNSRKIVMQSGRVARVRAVFLKYFSRKYIFVKPKKSFV